MYWSGTCATHMVQEITDYLFHNEAVDTSSEIVILKFKQEGKHGIGLDELEGPKLRGVDRRHFRQLIVGLYPHLAGRNFRTMHEFRTRGWEYQDGEKDKGSNSNF